VELLGMFAGQQAVADNGVLIDTAEASGLSDATALGDVFQNGDDLVLRQAGIEQGVPLRSEKRALQVLQ
jgi:hypothetical protein